MSSRKSPQRRWGFLLLACALLLAAPSGAHPLAPALLELHELEGGLAKVRWKTSRTRVPGSNAQPQVPSACTQVGEAVAREHETSIITEWTIDCGGSSLVGQRVGVSDLARARIDALVRVRLLDGRVFTEVLRAGSSMALIPERPRAIDVAASYCRLGLEHILTGWDHLLFVLGLVLLLGATRSLFWTITAFTLGHSLTLSVAVLGFTDFPSGVIEAGIALSIYLLAVELARGERERPGWIRRFPAGMAISFGLLHGLGFAGALTEVGLPQGEIPLALLAFNVGIEVGQLVFVGGALTIGVALGRSPVALPAWLERVPAYAIGSLGAFWCIERLTAL